MTMATQGNFSSPSTGSLTTGDNAFLNVPGEKKSATTRESLKEPPKTPLLNKSLYPLYLRRGAVSPASFSLKSTSTASSLNALPRGYNELCNALSGKGPIILLSDQASVQSLCSINSRMACSCSSLKSVGSDGSQGAATNAHVIGGNLPHAGSDGSFVSSPPAKIDGTQATLSVPVECHGKRRDSNGNYSLLTTENVSRGDASENNNETKENLHVSVETAELVNETRDTNISKTDTDATPTNKASSVTDISDNTQRELTPVNLDQNSRCKHCREISGTIFTFKNATDVENSPSKNNEEIKLPVKPVPVVGRAVSAYSIMEYNLQRNVLPSNGQRQEQCKDMSNVNDEENTPKRRHSAFTPCDSTTSTVKRRKGRLSTGCMREHVAECEPLINGNVVQASPDEVFATDKEVENIVNVSDQNNVLGGKRMRKSGVSVCYSPTKFTQVSAPSSEDITVTENKNYSLENTNEEPWIRPIHPCSSNGYLPTYATQHEHFPELERTSRV